MIPLKDLIAQFEAYENELKQLVETLRTAGKNSYAIRLMSVLTKRDIGMLCWQIPDKPQPEAVESIQRLRTSLMRIRSNAEAIKTFARKESGPPTLSMMAYQILSSVDRGLSFLDKIS
jgi:hypothetical protein